MKEFGRRLFAITAVLVLAGCVPAARKTDDVSVKPEKTPRRVEAQVSEVITKSGNAVINAGRLDGVAPADVFDIYRDGLKIAQMRVAILSDSQCGGRIFLARKVVKRGDRAVLVLPESRGVSDSDRQRLQLPPTTVTDGSLSTAVLAVRGSDNSVILNAGSEQGVQVGQSFLIYRDGYYVGRVRVTLVKPAMSGALILEAREALGRGFRALSERPENNAGPDKGTVSTRQMIKELEARIQNPKTSPEDRAAARKVLEELRADRIKTAGGAGEQ